MQDGSVTPQIRVLVADEVSRVVRDLQAMEQSSGEIGICGLARTPSSLLEEGRRLQPDVILINESYFGIDIVFAAAELVHVAPDAVVIVITSDPARAERRGRRAGIKGFVGQDATTEEIVALIRTLRGVSAPEAPTPAVPALAEAPPWLVPDAAAAAEPAGAEPLTAGASAAEDAPGEEAPAPAWGQPAAEPAEEAPAPAWGLPAPEPAEEAHAPAWDQPAAEPAEEAHDDTPAWGVAPPPEPAAEPAEAAPAWGAALPEAADAAGAEVPGTGFGLEDPTEQRAWQAEAAAEGAPSPWPAEEAEAGTHDDAGLGAWAAEAAPEPDMAMPVAEPATPPPAYDEPAYSPPAPTVVPELEPEPEPAAELPEPIQPVTPRRIRRGSKSKAEIFFVFSGKGGVGKSTVAANLAVALATDRDANVAVIDLDLQFGDLGIMYGIDAKHSIESLVDQGEQVDPDYLEDTLSDGPAGVRVLLAPPSPELADLVSSANLRSILRELSRAYDYVVIDGPAHLEERTLEVIELADQLIVVTAFNVTAVKDTKVTLKVLSSLGVDKEKISIVLNQTRARTNFTREQVEENLRFRVVAQLPYDPRIVDDAIDHGKPFVLSDPKAEITRQIHTLVDFLSPPGEASAASAKDKSGVNRRRFSLGRG